MRGRGFRGGGGFHHQYQVSSSNRESYHGRGAARAEISPPQCPQGFAGPPAMAQWLRRNAADLVSMPEAAMRKLQSEKGLSQWNKIVAFQTPTPELVAEMIALVAGPLTEHNHPTASWDQNLMTLLAPLAQSPILEHTRLKAYIYDSSSTLPWRSISMERLERVLNVLESLLKRFTDPIEEFTWDVIELAEKKLRDKPESFEVLFKRVEARQQASVSAIQQRVLASQLQSSAYGNCENNLLIVYRGMNIFPSSDEIRGRWPLQRPNVVNSSSPNFELHLDTHFRLLHEDCMRPLRVGIAKHLRPRFDENGRVEKNLDFRIYHQVQVTGLGSGSSGLAYEIQFNCNARIQWRNSKRLRMGSLVCLTLETDNFKGELMWATVASRNVDEATNEIHLAIRFPSVIERQFRLGEMYSMAETPVFFEGFQHTLKALQKIDVHTFPFKDYLTGRRLDVSRPSHSLAPTMVDVNQMLSKEGVTLDESQAKAVELCLTKEVALVQGPPGTGKSFVGVQVIKVLYEQMKLRHSNAPPILVVCFTNHALDQLLEDILKFIPEKDVIRVGGRSKNKNLDPINLFNKRVERTQNQEMNRLVARSHGLEQQLMSLCQKFEDAVIPPDEFEHILNEDQRRFFKTLQDDYDKKIAALVQKQPAIINLVATKKAEIEKKEKSLELEKGKKEGTSTKVAVENMQKLLNNLQINLVDATTERNESASMIRQLGTSKINVVKTWLEQDSPMTAGSSTGAKKCQAAAAPPIPTGQPQTIGEGDEDVDTQSTDELCDDEIDRLENDRNMGDAGEKIEFKPLRFSSFGQSNPTDKSMVTELARGSRLRSLTKAERQSVYESWRHAYHDKLKKKLLETCKEYDAIVSEKKLAVNNEQVGLLRSAAVVGFTTTGAAKYLDLLAAVKCEIVVIEEAAEVLEAHVLTTLTENTRHLIMIGDHKQLRPKVVTYELDQKFHLGVSLFERLVNIGIPYVTLTEQRRMRPEICQLTKGLYSPLEIQCHPSVSAYQDIKGMNRNIHFFDHRTYETKDQDLQSWSNELEARWVVNLAQYLMKQGYLASQITIIVPYTGQLFLIKKCLRNCFKHDVVLAMRVACIDNYQGEENDIILLSLVRSNAENNSGFVKDPHRACVALSRARQGFYVVGNFETVTTYRPHPSEIDVWNPVCNDLREQGLLSNCFEIKCQIHGRTNKLHTAEDFMKFREGGCAQSCDTLLDCGHKCTFQCHSQDVDHRKYKCLEKCMRKCAQCKPSRPCEHPCKKQCLADCGKCEVRITVTLDCGHSKSIACHEEQNYRTTVKCDAPCETHFDCGHRCTLKCGQRCFDECQKKVPKLIPICGHEIEMQCHKVPIPSDCTKKCTFRLDCGHVCPGTCGTCSPDASGQLMHQSCKQNCKKTLPCGHQCEKLCAKFCRPCEKKCDHVCFHGSQCRKTCGDLCVPCALPCPWKCPHYQCTLLCHEPCNRPPCDTPCPKNCIKGIHPCPGLCGETCPSTCPLCELETKNGKKKKGKSRVSSLKPTPIIQLACGHTFSVSYLDKYMGLVPQPPQMTQTITKWVLKYESEEFDGPLIPLIEIQDTIVMSPSTSTSATSDPIHIPVTTPPTDADGAVDPVSPVSHVSASPSPGPGSSEDGSVSFQPLCPAVEVNLTPSSTPPVSIQESAFSHDSTTTATSSPSNGLSPIMPNAVECPSRLKECPTCKKPIRVCSRYNVLIKQTLKQIESAKQIALLHHPKV